jgi:hypothetical protein
MKIQAQAAEIFLGPLLCFTAEISTGWQHCVDPYLSYCSIISLIKFRISVKSLMYSTRVGSTVFYRILLLFRYFRAKAFPVKVTSLVYKFDCSTI